jgi:SNF2 family DNA or RNA helicase
MLHEETGYSDLFLFYWIEIYPIGTDPDEDDEGKNLTDAEKENKIRLRKIASKIKNKIDLREIYYNKNPLKGDEVYEKYKEKELYCPAITNDNMEICFIEWEEQEHTAHVLFYRIKEKWKLSKVQMDESEDKSLLTAIHRDITFRNNIVEDWNSDFELKLDEFTENLGNPKFYDLEELKTDNIRTKLFSYQLHNVNKMIESENNPIMEIITDDHLFFYGDGTRIYNYYRDEDTTWEEFPKIKIKGIIIADQMGIGKTLQALALIDEQNHNRKKNDEKLLKTIIIVPDHLTEHWNNEISKHLKELNNELIDVKSFTDLLKMTIVEGDYDRCIVDEIHELYSKEENEVVFNKINELKFTFKHGLTGTPFPCENSIFNLLKFLTDEDLDLENMERFEWNFKIYDKIFVRNTLENITNEVILPPLKEHTCFLNFNQQEKILYETELEAKNDADEMFLRKLCCDVMINFKNKNVRILTLKDFIDVVVNDYRTKYEIEKQKCDDIIEIIDAIEAEINDILKGKNEDQIEIFENKISSLKKNKEIYVNKLQRQSQLRDNKKKSYDFLMIQIESKKECPVCLDEICDQDTYNMLPCGHIYCNECYLTILSGKPRCDVCFKHIDKGQITQISNYSEKKMNYGTKINTLIMIANDLTEKKKSGEILNNKVIIYSQFPEMLDELVEILNSEKISSIIFNDHKDIENFKNNENIQCLVISSNKNASGMDLSFVSNLVIYEPIKGNKSYLRDIEKQIIARIYRLNQTEESNIYRLIINDTIEKKIYDELISSL